MIHSAETVERIRAWLLRSGVPYGEILDEMTDHYLSDIERQIDLDIDPQMAMLSTQQKIATTDLRVLRKLKRPKILFAALPIFLLAIFIYVYQDTPESDQLIFEESEIVTEPDGWPLEASVLPITSHFGVRRYPVTKAHKHHNGIDIKAKIGTPVLATGAAVVQKIGFNKNAGNFIILQHNSRFSTIYYHLSEVNVQENETVAKGSIIGKVGNTGRSTAPHLHYEIKDGDAHIDPLDCARV